MAATPYRKRKSGKLYYRQPAYLLCTDLKHGAVLPGFVWVFSLYAAWVEVKAAEMKEEVSLKAFS